MNAVEIEEAVSRIAEQPFDAESFAYAFLEAFGNKQTTIQRLKSGSTNQSDLGGVLQRNNIHLKVCPEGQVTATLTALRDSPKTVSQKVKFILATDGVELQAESLEGEGDTLACEYPKFADYFAFFLPLAGISTVRQIRENAFDIKATARLNRLYIELLKDNPDWATDARREDLNHFIARLIFCFFAEDTHIFPDESLFTTTVEQMSARDSSNTHEVISELFRAMNLPVRVNGVLDDSLRKAAGIKPWANPFPYVNGGLFGTPGAPTPSSVSANSSAPQWYSRGYLPHCDSQSLIQHITFRLADSLSQEKLKQLEAELNVLSPEQRDVEKRKKIETWLDAGMGCCALAHPEAATIVQNTFLHGDGEQYRLIAWCIMPNHVHVLIEPKAELATIVQAWKSISSRRISALNDSLSLGIPNPHQLWMREYWDRYIRDQNHLHHCIDYIRQNPVKAGLCATPDDWPWSGSPGSSHASLGCKKEEASEGASAPSVPYFSKMARNYLLHVGNLDWTKINPDIFGSMIQAVADDEERGALGMHYTSVPNILKVLNPLFLDELRAKLEQAGDNPRTLLNLRHRLARIRVFDPACGSGNFLVIAYKEMRAIEAEINQRRGESERKSAIPLTNFRGIELRHFSCEIARLALIIAEYQCDVLYRGQQLALAEFLPLAAANWITCGNALRLDWLSVCPPTGKSVKLRSDDLFTLETPSLTPGTPTPPLASSANHADEGVGAPRLGAPSEIDFENEGGETYICGNPPYLGSTWQSNEQKSDLKAIFDGRTKSWKSLDYVAGWFMKAADYGQYTPCAAAFVSTNSICQGQQVPILWPLIFATGHEITFAHTSFKWNNLASHNAGVTVAIIGLGARTPSSAPYKKRLFSLDEKKETISREVDFINAYLVPAANVIVDKVTKPLNFLPDMVRGNIPVDGGYLYLNESEKQDQQYLDGINLIRLCLGAEEFISGKRKYCLWLKDIPISYYTNNDFVINRLKKVAESREKSSKLATQSAKNIPHLFFECRQNGDEAIIAIPAISSENREYLPVGLLKPSTIITGKMYGLLNAPLWNMALIASRLHWVWIGTVCVRMRTDFSYSNTLGWNTFPVPTLTEQNKADLTRCAEEILLAREAHFPATIADLYDPAKMPENLRRAHERNDEVLERIYIGRRFRNDTERLEKLFELYTKMTASAPTKKVAGKRKG